MPKLYLTVCLCCNQIITMIFLLLEYNTNITGKVRVSTTLIYLSTIYIPYVYVTGFWKTDQNVTLCQFHFIGPANSHTHTPSMHCCNTRFSCVVCFSRANFADHVKSRLRQWNPWRVLDGRYGSDIHPCASET